ncbi:MAG: sugar O-acetyltransferase [Colwellia sp.]
MTNHFNSITPKLIAQRKAVHELCRQFSRSPSKGNLKRVKTLFQSCGQGVIIESGLHMDYGSSINLGDRVYININCTFIDGHLGNVHSNRSGSNSDDSEHDTQIRLGDDCLIGPNVQFLAVSHDIEPVLRQAHKYNYVKGITLQHNVWLGAGVIVLAGVNIGENSVVGAGSVVTKDIDANSFYAGNPAVKVRVL